MKAEGRIYYDQALTAESQENTQQLGTKLAFVYELLENLEIACNLHHTKTPKAESSETSYGIEIIWRW